MDDVDMCHAQDSSKTSGHCSINRKLLPLKLFYFAFLAAVGALLPFVSIYMKQLGLTSNETGILYGAMPFIGFFVRPIIGALADHWHKHKLALILSSALTGIFYLLILAIPARVTPSFSLRTQLLCNVQDSYFRDCVSTSIVADAQNPPCTYGISDFASAVANATQNGNSTDYDCRVECSESAESPDQNVDACFTDSPEEFVHRCNGTVVSHGTPLSFSLLNVSHVLNNEVVSDRRTISTVQCKDFDLKSLQHEGRSFWQLLCDEEGTFECRMMCTNLPAQLCPQHNQEFDATFGWFFLIFLIGNLAFAPVFSLADAAAYDTLGEEKNRFGEQRLWGTVGFAVFAITSTFIMYMMSRQGSTINYTVSFYIFAVMCCLAAGAAYLMHLSAKMKCRNMSGNLLALLKVPQMLAFLVVVTYFGMSTGLIESFLFWYLTDMGATTVVFGVSLVINCLFEVPMFMVSGLIISKVGPVACLYISMFALVVRHLGYSLLVNPWWVLVIEPLHGVTFGLMWSAASNYAATIAPQGMSATVQGVVGGLHFGVGKGLGSILAGFLFKQVGERWTFRVYAIISACLLVLYAFLNYVVFKAHASAAQPQSQEVKSETEGDSMDDGQNGEPLLSADTNTSINTSMDKKA